MEYLQARAGVEGRPPWRRGHGPEQGWSSILYGVGVQVPERATELRGGDRSLTGAEVRRRSPPRRL